MFPVHFANVVLFNIALSLALKHPEIIWIRLETNPVPWDKSTPTQPPCHGCRIQKFLSWSSKKFLSLQHSSNSLSSSLLSEKDDWVRLTSAQQVSPLKIGDGWDQTLKKQIITSLLLGYPEKQGSISCRWRHWSYESVLCFSQLKINFYQANEIFFIRDKFFNLTLC